MKALTIALVSFSALMMMSAMTTAKPMASAVFHPASIKPWVVTGYWSNGHYYHHRRWYHHHHHTNVGIVVHL
jgi:hypothetical protein